MPSLSLFTAAIAAIFALVFLLHKFTKNHRQANTVPLAPGSWPLTGHLHLLAGSQLPHKLLGSMADKLGPIFTIKLGAHKALVVNSSAMAKECFTTNDKTFANRPKSKAVALLGYNYASLGFAPYGPYWRALRKIAALELLSQSRTLMLAHVRTSEVNFSMKELFDDWKNGIQDGQGGKVKIEMKDWFQNLTLNVILRMIAGKRYSSGDQEGDRFKRTVRSFVELLGTVTVSDVIPSLKWLDFFSGHEKEIKKTARAMDGFFEEWLDEQTKKITSGEVVEAKDQVFMGTMLSRFETEYEKDLSGFDMRTIIKATCSTILVGASDTTTVTLTWALALLMNNPQTLKKAQEEIEMNVGYERQVEESDLKNLVYLHAILKETMRLYPAGPIIAPHESTEDCVVGGYNVPKGMRLMVNLWKIHRDPLVWDEPYEFRPERFLTRNKEIDVWGQNFELMPFGSGRRICVGIGFALQAMQLVLASLIQGFELSTQEPVDMTECAGLTNLKATPLEVFVKPRLSPRFYEHELAY